LNTRSEPLRVLIADDHQPTRDDVRRALGDDDTFDICAVASDAAQAVHAAVCERPDICLLDVRMPGGGVAAAWEIAARLPSAKIVMLTVSDDDADLFAALRAGADGYLLKTMNLMRLRDALVGVCSGEAAIQRTLVARVLDRFRGREPRWRQVVGGESARWRLTSREWEVLELLAQRRSTAAIAEELVLSASAVRVHIASIVRKLEVADRAAVAELFRRSRA
jgi:DNA-binding NarL/FixJ family response regulator